MTRYGWQLVLRTNIRNVRHFMERCGLLPDQRWYWRHVERSFMKVDGEVEACRILADGRWRWTLSARGEGDVARTVHVFRNCARHGARVYQHYRWHTGAPVDLVEAWLELITLEERGVQVLARAERASAITIPAAVDASRRFAARRQRDYALP